jgi:hypothetical protein
MRVPSSLSPEEETRLYLIRQAMLGIGPLAIVYREELIAAERHFESEDD